MDWGYGVPMQRLEPLLKVEDLAVVLALTVGTIRYKLSQGHLPQPIRAGGTGHPRWRADVIRDWIAAGCPKFEHDPAAEEA